MSTPLSARTVAEISRTAAVPRYDRAALSAGIVHIGVGNFHRAHQAVYLDDLFNLGEGHDWALVGAGVRAADANMREKLKAQDWLTTVVEQEADHSAARVTGAMIDYLPVGDAEALLSRIADPTIRIVSLTITEGGYFIDPASGVFNPAHPDIVADAQPGATPKTVFGIILAGLIRRRDEGTVPFTVMSCDNIPHNGHVTSDGVIGLIEAGVINNSRKKLNRGKSVTSFVNGTRRLFDFVDDNPGIRLMDIGYVNDTAVIRQNPRVAAINSAIEIDLTGQICADSMGSYQYSGIGGQMDFIHGASLSEGGLPIIAMPSVTSTGMSRIVPFLKEGAGVVTTRGHVHWVVTEYGKVNLFGKNLKQRAQALVSIAHPQHRAWLDKAFYARYQHINTTVLPHPEPRPEPAAGL